MILSRNQISPPAHAFDSQNIVALLKELLAQIPGKL